MNSATVLYVEDEEFDAIFMRRAFAKCGLEVELVVVVDGQQAINYLADACPVGPGATSRLPDLVLLDLNLPICNGFDVLQWIRRQPALQSLPVVVFSSSPREEDRVTAEKFGADDYVQKPSSGVDFRKVAQDIHERFLLPPARRTTPAADRAVSSSRSAKCEAS